MILSDTPEPRTYGGTWYPLQTHLLLKLSNQVQFIKCLQPYKHVMLKHRDFRDGITSSCYVWLDSFPWRSFKRLQSVLWFGETSSFLLGPSHIQCQQLFGSALSDFGSSTWYWRRRRRQKEKQVIFLDFTEFNVSCHFQTSHLFGCELSQLYLVLLRPKAASLIWNIWPKFLGHKTHTVRFTSIWA